MISCGNDVRYGKNIEILYKFSMVAIEFYNRFKGIKSINFDS